MRILIVSDAWTPQVNGVVRTYEDLIRHLQAQHHSVRMIGPGDFPWRRPLPGYAEIELAMFPARRLAAMIADFGPETIHIATEGPLGWAARRYCLKRGWPFTTAYHSHFPDYAAVRAARISKRLHKPVREIAIRMMRRFHAPSSAVLTTTASVDDTLRAWGLEAPLHRLTRGVDMDVFHPGPATLFADLPRPVALYVGRVAIEKNIGAFLDMDWPGSKVVVGGGPSLEDFRRRYPGVVFAGVQKGHSLADHYRSADVFVFPSRTDTFGIVLIEAMACGLPLAGYRVPGPADVVTAPLLGAIGDDLEKAAQIALDAPGGAAERFDYLQRTYSWDVATAQFLDAQEQAMISRS